MEEGTIRESLRRKVQCVRGHEKCLEFLNTKMSFHHSLSSNRQSADSEKKWRKKDDGLPQMLYLLCWCFSYFLYIIVAIYDLSASSSSSV